MFHGRQKLDSIEKAKEGGCGLCCAEGRGYVYWVTFLPCHSVPGAVSPEELIRYAHRISQASSAVSPVGWQPSKFYVCVCVCVCVCMCVCVCVHVRGGYIWCSVKFLFYMRFVMCFLSKIK